MIQIPTDIVLVRIKNSYDLENVLSKINIAYKSYRRLGHNENSYLIVLKNGESINIANYLYESGYFDYAQPSFTRLIRVMNDFYPDQWGLNNTGQNGGTVGIDIDAPQAWNLTTGCADIVIAVIDQGVDLDHPDLDNNLLAGYDATDGGSGGVNGDCWGNDAHGTACAGIIAAEDNTIGIIGVAPNCNIVPIRIFYTINDQLISDDYWIVDAINHAWEIDGVDIMSCSWGGGYPSSAINNEINDALTQGRNNLGCIIIFSTGNYNSEVLYPANSNPDIIAVGAMSMCGERKRSSSNAWEVNPGVTPDPAGVSCDGEKWWGSNYGSQLDLVAPGVLIPTTDIQSSAGYNTSSGTSGDYYTTFNGTSSATPHVAGIAALILSINSSLTQDQVRDAIESSCDKVGDYSYSTTSGRSNGTWNNEMGYGVVNAHNAILSIYPYITGPSLVCTSNTTFTLHDRPPGTTVNWTRSSNLRYVSGQGTDNYTVKAYWYSAGPGWVDATITNDCGDIIIHKYIPWIGNPDSDDLDIINTLNYPDNTLCEGDQNQLVAYYDGSQTILDYDWDYSGWSHFEVGDKDFISYVTVPYSFSYKDIKLRAANQCGESEWKTERFYPNQNCGYFFSFSPNPADDYVEIRIDESKLAENEIDYYEVRIYNSLKIAVYETGKTKEPVLRINTKQFQNGVYFIYIIAGEKTDVKQLVVSH